MEQYIDVAKAALDEGISRMVPVRLSGEYFGFPGPDVETMMRWSRATQNDMFHNYTDDPAIRRDNIQAGTEMKAYVTRLVAQRRAELDRGQGGDDVLARLLKSRFPAEVEFDDERVIDTTGTNRRSEISTSRRRQQT